MKPVTIADLPKSEKEKVSRLVQKLISLGREHELALSALSQGSSSLRSHAHYDETSLEETANIRSLLQVKEREISQLQSQYTMACSLLEVYGKKLKILRDSINYFRSQSKDKSKLILQLEQKVEIAQALTDQVTAEIKAKDDALVDALEKSSEDQMQWLQVKNDLNEKLLTQNVELAQLRSENVALRSKLAENESLLACPGIASCNEYDNTGIWEKKKESGPQKRVPHHITALQSIEVTQHVGDIPKKTANVATQYQLPSTGLTQLFLQCRKDASLSCRSSDCNVVSQHSPRDHAHTKRLVVKSTDDCTDPHSSSSRPVCGDFISQMTISALSDESDASVPESRVDSSLAMADSFHVEDGVTAQKEGSEHESHDTRPPPEPVVLPRPEPMIHQSFSSIESDDQKLSTRQNSSRNFTDKTVLIADDEITRDTVCSFDASLVRRKSDGPSSNQAKSKVKKKLKSINRTQNSVEMHNTQKDSVRGCDDKFTDRRNRVVRAGSHYDDGVRRVPSEDRSKFSTFHLREQSRYAAHTVAQHIKQKRFHALSEKQGHTSGKYSQGHNGVEIIPPRSPAGHVQYEDSLFELLDAIDH